MAIRRRDLLKAGLAGIPLFGLGSSVRAIAGAAATRAAPAGFQDRRMLTIFLRGGLDGLNAVIPHGDPGYAALRPGIGYGPQGSGSPLSSVPFPGYSQLGLHPQLAEISGLITQGKLAMLGRVGNFLGERSHFTEQHRVETGRQEFLANAEGWTPQIVSELTTDAIMPSLSVSNRLQRQYLSSGINPSTNQDKASTHIQMAYASADAQNRRVIDISFAETGMPGRRIARLARNATELGRPSYPIVGEGSCLQRTLTDSIDDLQSLRTNLASFPHQDARYPAANVANANGWPLPKYAQFFERLEESVEYLKQGFSNVVGIELGGWDTHGGQIAAHNELMPVLARAIRSANDDLDAAGRDYLILVVSDFGRTAADNGGAAGSSDAGTDHGIGGLYMAIGNRVVGGAYNYSRQPWLQAAGSPTGVAPWRLLNSLSSNPQFANAVIPATDFRVPLIEVASAHFGIPNIGALEEVGPEWGPIDANARNLRRFRKLGFLT